MISALATLISIYYKNIKEPTPKHFVLVSFSFWFLWSHIALFLLLCKSQKHLSLSNTLTDPPSHLLHVESIPQADVKDKQSLIKSWLYHDVSNKIIEWLLQVNVRPSLNVVSAVQAKLCSVSAFYFQRCFTVHSSPLSVTRG